MKPIYAFGLGGVFLMLATSAMAVDSWSIAAGSSFESPRTTTWRIGAQWDWEKKWLTDGAWFLTGSWDASVGRWRSNDVDGDHDVADFAVTPVFRYQKSGSGDFIPYVEAAVGLHYLTNTVITRHRRFSTHFQFGTQVGAGLRFGKSGQYNLAYSLHHVSNADIDEPNPGIDFQELRFMYHY